MRARILRETTPIDVPLAFMRGSKRLFGHDFVAVQNQLVFEREFLSTITGVSLISPGSSPAKTKAPGVEITGEFRRDRATGELDPLWYGFSLTNPARSANVKLKTVSKDVEAGEGRIARIEGLIEQEGQYIPTNTVRVEVSGQPQRRSSYYLDNSDGTLVIDMSDLPEGTVPLTVRFELVEPGIQVDIGDGVFDLRLFKHYESSYSVRVLLSRRTTGSVSYQYQDEIITEVLTPSILYRLISSELVAEDTYTYGFDSEGLKLPSKRSFQIFAVRSSRPESPTNVFVLPPEGVPVDSPWFVRVGGVGEGEYTVKELEQESREIVSRREIVEPIGPNSLAISARKVELSRDNEGRLAGIVVYPQGFEDRIFPVEGFDGETGIITLGLDVAPNSKLVVEYREDVDWFEYEGIQLNPSLKEDDTTLADNYVLLYIDPDISELRSINHTYLPKIVGGEFKRYTNEEVKEELAKVSSRALPLALLENIDPVDEDYYQDYDTRTLGGYIKDLPTLSSIAIWGGEDADITGVMVAKIPPRVVDNLTQRLIDWENFTDTDAARREAIRRIEATIERNKRIGMKVIKEYTPNASE